MVANNSKRDGVGIGIDPARLYTADDLRRLWGAGQRLPLTMERAGFKWRRVAWRDKWRFATGQEIIDFVLGDLST